MEENSKRTVWILNHYAGGMLRNKGGRHYWFAKYLNRAGFKPTIFASNIDHNSHAKYIETDKLYAGIEADEIGTEFVFVKSTSYKGNGADRILNMFSFYCNVQKAARRYADDHGRPDLIYASSVHPLTLIAGLKLAKHFNVKCICEIRDLWPEAIISYSERIGRDSTIAKLMYLGEKWIYEHADALIFTQEGGIDYLKEKGWDTEHGGRIALNKVFHINNGVDLEAFDSNARDFMLQDEDLDDKSTYKIVYAGAVRRINNLGILIDAARYLDQELDGKRAKLLIYGDGDEFQELSKRLKDEKISNVIMKGRINKQYIPSILIRSDLNIVHWEMNPLVRFGESYNKAFEYFAAAKPVFYTIRPGYSIVERYGAGRITEGYSPKEIAKGITEILTLAKSERDELSVNARHVAELYDFKVLTNKLIAIINSITCEC